MTRQRDRIRLTSVRNDSGEEIPAFAVMRPTGFASLSGRRNVVTVGKPDADNDTNVLINGTAAIPDGNIGAGSTLFPTYIAYDTADTITAGDDWGVASGSWKLAKGKTGFKAIGGESQKTGVALFNALGGAASILLGKTTTSHSSGATETINLYSGATKGSESATGESVEAYNRFADLATDQWVYVSFIDGGYEIVAADPC